MAKQSLTAGLCQNSHLHESQTSNYSAISQPDLLTAPLIYSTHTYIYHIPLHHVENLNAQLHPLEMNINSGCDSWGEGANQCWVQLGMLSWKKREGWIAVRWYCVVCICTNQWYYYIVVINCSTTVWMHNVIRLIGPTGVDDLLSVIISIQHLLYIEFLV